MNRLIQFLLIALSIRAIAFCECSTRHHLQRRAGNRGDLLEDRVGHFDEYVDWLNSTWKPLNEAKKKAGLIIDYKVFTARPKKSEEPNVIFMIIYPNMAAFDRRVEENAVAVEMIGSAKEQDKARIARSAYRTRIGTELIREVILK